MRRGTSGGDYSGAAQSADHRRADQNVETEDRVLRARSSASGKDLEITSQAAAAGLMPVACPCGVGMVPVSREHESLKLVSCPACGLLSRAERPSETDLLHGYQHEYWSRFRDEQMGRGRQNIQAHALDWLQQLHPENGLLVDVGCGAGALLGVCRGRGWKALGFDVSPEAIAAARAEGLEAVLEAWPPSTLSDATADAVAFINVLDHLASPCAALKEAWRVLRPGGFLYVRVPNAPMHLRVRRLLDVLGLGRLPVFHVFGFGRASLHHHLVKAGFEVCGVQTAPPSQEFAYAVARGWKAIGIRLLKMSDRLLYQGMAWSGLDRLGWGLSLEAMARKPMVN